MGNTSYDIWIKIIITHSYFYDTNCRINLVPDEKTFRMFKKSNILFKQYNSNTWVILKPESEEEQHRIKMIIEEEQDENDEKKSFLQFNLINTGDDFYYYTEIKPYEPPESQKGDWECKDICKNGIVFQLKIHITTEMLPEMKTVQLDLKSKMKYMEFILIPKYTDEQVKISLIEKRNLINLTYIKKDKIPGEPKEGFIFISEEEIEMKEKYEYKIGLWKIKEKGEYMLSADLKHPSPSSISIFSPKDRITSYIYF